MTTNNVQKKKSNVNTGLNGFGFDRIYIQHIKMNTHLHENLTAVQQEEQLQAYMSIALTLSNEKYQPNMVWVFTSVHCTGETHKTSTQKCIHWEKYWPHKKQTVVVLAVNVSQI